MRRGLFIIIRRFVPLMTPENSAVNVDSTSKVTESTSSPRRWAAQSE